MPRTLCVETTSNDAESASSPRRAGNGRTRKVVRRLVLAVLATVALGSGLAPPASASTLLVNSGTTNSIVVYPAQQSRSIYGGNQVQIPGPVVYRSQSGYAQRFRVNYGEQQWLGGRWVETKSRSFDTWIPANASWARGAAFYSEPPQGFYNYTYVRYTVSIAWYNASGALIGMKNVLYGDDGKTDYVCTQPAQGLCTAYDGHFRLLR
jgi:hypothetical protein